MLENRLHVHLNSLGKFTKVLANFLQITPKSVEVNNIMAKTQAGSSSSLKKAAKESAAQRASRSETASVSAPSGGKGKIHPAPKVLDEVAMSAAATAAALVVATPEEGHAISHRRLQYLCEVFPSCADAARAIEAAGQVCNLQDFEAIAAAAESAGEKTKTGSQAGVAAAAGLPATSGPSEAPSRDPRRQPYDPRQAASALDSSKAALGPAQKGKTKASFRPSCNAADPRVAGTQEYMNAQMEAELLEAAKTEAKAFYEAENEARGGLENNLNFSSLSDAFDAIAANFESAGNKGNAAEHLAASVRRSQDVLAEKDAEILDSSGSAEHLTSARRQNRPDEEVEILNSAKNSPDSASRSNDHLAESDQEVDENSADYDYYYVSNDLSDDAEAMEEGELSEETAKKKEWINPEERKQFFKESKARRLAAAKVKTAQEHRDLTYAVAKTTPEYEHMLMGTKLPLDTKREDFVALAKRQDNNEHLKQFLANKWNNGKVSEVEKADPKSAACRELKTLLWGAVTGRHKRAKTAAKDNFAKQQARRAKGQGQPPRRQPSDDVQLLGAYQPVGRQSNKRSREDRSPAPSPSGQPSKRPQLAGPATGVEVVTLDTSTEPKAPKLYKDALSDALNNPLALQIVRVVKDKHGLETYQDVNGDDWRDNLCKAWADILELETNKAMEAVDQLDKARAAGTEPEGAVEPWFPSILDTIFREGKIYIVPADEDTMHFVIGSFEDLKVVDRSFKAVACTNLPDTCLLFAKVPGHYIPDNPQADWIKVQFLSGLPRDGSSRFHKLEQIGSGVVKKLIFRVTKPLVSVLKGTGTRGRRAGCLKLKHGSFEIWYQGKPLLEVDTEAIKYDKRDMS